MSPRAKTDAPVMTLRELNRATIARQMLLERLSLPVVTAIVAQRIGVRTMGLSLGLLFSAHSVGAAAGALMGGWLYDLFARYQEMWWAAFALCLAAALLALSLGGPMRRARADVPNAPGLA